MRGKVVQVFIVIDMKSWNCLSYFLRLLGYSMLLTFEKGECLLRINAQGRRRGTAAPVKKNYVVLNPSYNYL